MVLQDFSVARFLRKPIGLYGNFMCQFRANFAPRGWEGGVERIREDGKDDFL